MTINIVTVSTIVAAVMMTFSKKVMFTVWHKGCQCNDSCRSSARHCQSWIFICVMFSMNIFPMNVWSKSPLPVIIYLIEKGWQFVCAKRGILQLICCNIILVRVKIRPPATPPAQLGSCQRGRTLPCVVRPLKYPSPYFFPIRPACHVPLENEQLIAHFLWTLIFEKTSTFRHSDNEIKNLSGRS